MGHAHQSTEGHQGLHRVAKGQLILKGLFGVLKGRIKPKVDWRAHGLRTPNEGINQRYLKNWADVADKICCPHT